MMPGAYQPFTLPADRHQPAPRALPRPRCDPRRFAGVCEPPLAELLDDPILGRLLASDGIGKESLLALIAETRARLRAG